MSKVLEFFFDFGSPYSYFAFSQIYEIAKKNDVTVNLKAIILWPILKDMGAPAPLQDGPKARYLLHDMQRSAKFYGVEYIHPKEIAGSTHLAARAFHFIQAHNPELVEGYTEQVFIALFQQGKDIKKNTVLLEICHGLGFSEDILELMLSDQTAKQALNATVQEAAQRGVYGVPFMFVGEEAFFGADRLSQLGCFLE
ncbi:MAG: 2-hydroxychromene-2-carboxylate isomerase [Sneathiella sp.]